MAPFRGWAVLPVIGTGERGDEVRPDLRGNPAEGDRTEHVIEAGAGKCIVAADIADAARLTAGVALCTHDELATRLQTLAVAQRNRIRNALAAFGVADAADDDLRAFIRRAGRLLAGFENTFDPTLHLGASREPPTGSFVVDTLTDTAGTQIGAHFGETGATWTKHPNAGTPNGFINAAGRMYSDDAADFSGQDALYYASGIPATAEYTVAASSHVVAGGTGVNSEVEIWARLATGALTGYLLTFERNGVGGAGNGSMSLYRVSAGAFLSLGSYVPAIAEGNSYAHSIEALNATKKAFFGGVERISSTNNDITAAGRVGIQSRNITPVGGGLQLESVTATDAAPAPGGTVKTSGGGASTATERKTASASLASSSGGATTIAAFKTATRTVMSSGGGATTTTGAKTGTGSAVATRGGGASTLTGFGAGGPTAVLITRGGGATTLSGRKTARTALTSSTGGSTSGSGRKSARGAVSSTAGGSTTLIVLAGKRGRYFDHDSASVQDDAVSGRMGMIDHDVRALQ